MDVDFSAVLEKAEAGGYDSTPAEPAENTEVAASAGGGSGESQGEAGAGESGSAKGSASEAAPPVPGSKSEPDSSVPPVVEAKAEPEAPAKVEGEKPGVIDPDDEQTWQPQHNIPYDRFKSVIEKQRAAEQRAAQLERELEIAKTVRSMQQTEPAPEPDDDLLDTFFGDEGSKQVQALSKEVASLKSRLAEQDRARAEQEAGVKLDGEVERVRQRYPEVSKTTLYRAAAMPWGHDLESFAEQQQAEINAWKAAGVREYLASQGKPAAAAPAAAAQPGAPATTPAVPPRPAVSAPAATSGTVKEGFDLTDSEQRWEFARRKYAG